MLMGYQLYMLVVAVPEIPTKGLLLRPAPNALKSLTTSGGRPYFHALHCPAPLNPVQAGASPVSSTTPLPSRSAGCCRIRIALGWIPFAPGAVGSAVPRAKPRLSH